jgi:hypothetical protein
MENEQDLDLKPLWLRRLSWDALPCEQAPDIQVKLGLVPVTEEGQELDHRASHERMTLVNALQPAVEYFSALIGQVLSAALIYQASDEIKEQITEALAKQFDAQNAEIIRISTLVIIAQLISTGVLGYTEKVITR